MTRRLALEFAYLAACMGLGAAWAWGGERIGAWWRGVPGKGKGSSDAHR